MFCGECGAKNSKQDAFCAECGAPLVHEETQTNTTNVVKKPRQPMSKKKKVIIAVIVTILGVLGIGYKVGSDMTNPKAIAADYIKAVINKDSDRLYKYLEFDGDKTFVSKKIFKKIMNDASDDEISNIENYKITDITYGAEELTAKVKFTYTVKGSTESETEYVNLVKQKDKEFLIFDSWKIADLSSDSMIMKNYKVKAPKGTVITFSDVKVETKYLDKKESTSTLDVYVLPQVFTTENTIKAVFANGIEIEDKVTPSSYRSAYTVSLDEDNLTSAASEKITAKAKEALTTIYTNAINKKTFSEFKSSFEHGDLNLTALEKNYTDFLSDLYDYSTTLTGINFTTLTISDLSLNDDGNMKIKLKVNYDYTVTYTDYNDEVQTHEDSDYSYMTVVLVYDNGTYYLVDIDGLKEYFSRY